MKTTIHASLERFQTSITAAVDKGDKAKDKARKVAVTAFVTKAKELSSKESEGIPSEAIEALKAVEELETHLQEIDTNIKKLRLAPGNSDEATELQGTIDLARKHIDLMLPALQSVLDTFVQLFGETEQLISEQKDLEAKQADVKTRLDRTLSRLKSASQSVRSTAELK